jgi:predicted SAM-dependent methyltransferase
MLAAAPTFLHIAPEVSLMRRFGKIYTDERADRYVTADLESPLAKVKMDVQAIPFADNSFDVIFCNHILEHVVDDGRAMREMYRVMRAGGWGVMLSPVDEGRAETFEDDSVTDPAERTHLFGQYDHRRVYGRDYADRLRETGWQVEVVDYFATLTPAEQKLYGLRPEPIYIVRKACG